MILRKSILFLFACTLFLLTGCNNSNDILSGKTFDLAYPPGPLTETNTLEDHNVFTTLSFDNGTVIKEDGNEIQGEYELNKEVLSMTFKHDDEEYNVEFDNFAESDKEFSSYSAVVADSVYDTSDEGLNYFMGIANDFSTQVPIEFIEQ